MAAQLWEVIGGGAKGGIVARAGQDLKSPELPERLGTGALIEQEELVGERLRYKKVSGAGPQTGWVSLKLKGSDLLVKTVAKPKKKGPAPPPELTRDEALNLQKDLRDGFSQEEEFQKPLRELYEKYPSEEDQQGMEFRLAQQKLCQIVQLAVIAKYGFAAKPVGISQMVKILDKLSQEDVEFQLVGAEIGWLLGACKGPPPPKPAPQLVIRPPAGVEDAPVGEGGADEPPLPEGHILGRLNVFGLEGIANFRDMAGVDPAVPARKVEGGRLKRGKLFRTAAWTTATERDIDMLLNEIGVKTYFDLRQGKDYEAVDGAIWDAFPPSPNGRHFGEDLRSPGQPRRLHFNFARDTGYREFTEDELANRIPEDDRRANTSLWYQAQMRNGFGLTLERHLAYLNACVLYQNADIILSAMRACTDPANYPVAFGCMTGKDRTGLMAMLVFSALGASMEDIMEDYLITNLAAADNAEKIGWNMSRYEEEVRQKWEAAAAAEAEARREAAGAESEGVMAGVTEEAAAPEATEAQSPEAVATEAEPEAPAAPAATEPSKPEVEDLPVLSDLALRKPAEASSAKSEDRAAACAVDGNPETRWTSTYSDDQWLSVDLGAVCALSRVEIRWQTAHAETYELQGSEDNETWTTLASERGQDGWVATELPDGSVGRWIRMQGQKRATAFGFSIFEFRVLGRAPEGQTSTDKGSIASNVDNLKGAKVFRPVMEFTLRVLHRESGGPLKYLESIGFGPDEVQKLRELLVEPDSGAEPLTTTQAASGGANAWINALVGDYDEEPPS